MARFWPVPLWIYHHGSVALRPVARLALRHRVRRGKEDPDRLAERVGIAGYHRPQGRLAWLHGASVGETISLLPLVQRLIGRGFAVLMTSGTLTSARLMNQRLPPGAIHQFIPLDLRAYAARFLDHWQPDLALFAESELWPNLVLEAAARDIPLAIVNGRMSQRSYRRWQMMGPSIQSLLGQFRLCLVQTGADAQRFASLGAHHVAITGNLKYDVPPPPADPLKLASLSGSLSGRPVWMAASTHPGEDEQIGAVHERVAQHRPGLVTLIAPRHPQRGEAIAKALSGRGLRVDLRSRGTQPGPQTQIYVADTLGELGLFYRVAPLVFMGGSLVPHGGQNPIEPAKLGAGVLHGPHVHNFSDVYAALDQAGAALPIGDGADLAETLALLMGEGALVRAMARRAQDTVERLGGALERTLGHIDAILPPANGMDAR